MMINPKSRVHWRQHKSCFISPQVGSNPPCFFGQPVWWGLLVIALWRRAQKLSVLARHWLLNDQRLRGRAFSQILIKKHGRFTYTFHFHLKNHLSVMFSALHMCFWTWWCHGLILACKFWVLLKTLIEMGFQFRLIPGYVILLSLCQAAMLISGSPSVVI